MSRDIRILSTKVLKANQRQLLLNAGFALIEADFIRVTHQPFLLWDVEPNLIITSQNAVKAIASHPDVHQIRRNPVFCVGQKTADLLDETGFTVQESARSAQELANVIIENYISESFTFFSGNIRRNELPQALQEANVALNEIEVYETDLTPTKIAVQPNGILFFSPSGAKSFLKDNGIGNSVCFCIGQTTAAAIEGSNPTAITIANQPTIESTIAQCIQYYDQRQMTKDEGHTSVI